ncbi:undecaprenyl-diphosphate phosphatase [Candidatus Nomurabacteria bacterium]|nr:undecaprenyl-diphosphate phosphatase [Candidatus Nomurabacteria bacterium]
MLKAVVFGIVEGVTEWLPVSSTGHLILLDQFVRLGASSAFKELFLVAIQLGAIGAVIVLYWKKIFPFAHTQGEWKLSFNRQTLALWARVLVACIPAALIGGLFDKTIEARFYHPTVVAAALIIFGILFIIIERKKVREQVPARVQSLAAISYTDALLIGVFQLMAAVFPGTSRSGATIIGALLLGFDRVTASSFTFILAIPVMLGASLLKFVHFGTTFSSSELLLLLVGMATAFVISLLSIRLLLSYVQKHTFEPFGWYRVVLGIVVLAYFFL